ncbi:MAG: PQQ-dependent sugar dehydrogenase, partial [Chloroflexi bacterium]|nr:PQQ-dependent sugar dehydrogenase [Chloroflexota bacterium]
MLEACASPIARRALVGLLVAVCLFGTAGVTNCPRPYGLKPTPAVGPFLDGVFPTSTPQGNLSLGVELAFPNLLEIPGTALVIVTNPADDRLYLASRDGQIVSFENELGVSQSAPFMDLRDRTAVVQDGGFLGMVFHPEFGQVGSPYELTFYAYYATFCPTTAAGDGINFAACDPGLVSTWLRLSRFEAFWDPVDGVYKGDPASESPMLSIRLYGDSHRGGGMVIDDDHNLFLTIGDQYRFVTPQDIAGQLEGKILRLALDVVETGGGAWTCPAGSHLPIRDYREVTGNLDEMSGRLYCIPDDTPFLDPFGGIFEEPYSIGHRNPHRLTMDRVTGRLWTGEVGEA